MTRCSMRMTSTKSSRRTSTRRKGRGVVGGLEGGGQGVVGGLGLG